MGSHRSRLPLALAATVVAAGAATLLLRPRGGLIEPVAVDAQAYFSPAELDRAHDFADIQRVLGLSSEALAGLTLALIALRPPARVRSALDAAAERPWRGAGAVGACLSVTVTVVGLPLALWAHERAVDAGLSTQSLGPWLADTAKSTAIGAALAAGGAVLALALIRRFPARWWIPVAGAVVALSVAFTLLQPVVLDPLFNRFEPLPAGRLRSEVLSLADRAGVDVGQVYRVDASRRTTGINAYVTGLGRTKRVVLYDNLIGGRDAADVRSVVAHELAHVKYRDVPRGLLWLAIVAPAGTLLVQRLVEALIARGPGRRGGHRALPGPAILPAVALAFALVAFVLTPASNVLSRRVEARADTFALDVTGDPQAFIRVERTLALRNLADPDPPALLQALFGTHPTTVQRIGAGVAARRGAR